MNNYEKLLGSTDKQKQEKDPLLEKGAFKRIELRSVEDIKNEYLEEYDGDFNEEYYYEVEEDIEQEQEEKEIKQAINYVPFDSKEEFRKIREGKSIHTIFFGEQESGEDIRNYYKEQAQKTKRKISEIRENLIKQQKGISAVLRLLERTVRSHPDIGKEKLFDLVKKTSAQFRFSKGQITNFYYGIKEFQRRHEAVEKYRKAYPRDEELFQTCFGGTPQGEITVIKRPMTLHFVCYDRNDYNYAYTYAIRKAANVASNENKEEIDREYEKALKKAAESAGAVFSNIGIGELYRTITLEAANPNLVLSDETLIHEEQHQFNSLFQPRDASRLLIDVLKRTIAVNSKDGTQNSNLKSRLIHELARCERRFRVDNYARDEIIAYYKEGSRPNEIYRILSNSSLYDYRKDFEAQIGKDIQDDIRYNLSEVYYQKKKPPSDLYWDKNESGYLVGFGPIIVNEEEISQWTNLVLGDEYKKDLEQWINSISDLEKMGYSRNDIISFLYQEPVNKWTSLVRRFKKVRIEKEKSK